MKIANIHIFAYNLPLAKPFTVHKTTLTSRPGFLVYVVSSDGITGAGEIAPLEGLSPEPLKKALHQIKTLRPKLIGCEIPERLDDLKSFLNFDLFGGSMPAVHFGVESAFLHLTSQREQKIPSQMLGVSEPRDVVTAVLLQGTLDEVKSDAQRYFEEGCRVFKLKVGSKNIPLDVKKVQEVRAVIGPQSRLRLDANAAWSLTEAAAFGELIGPEGIEFIEDPLRELDSVEDFYKRTQLPVAIDESLGMAKPGGVTLPQGVQYFILKPTMIGGIFKTLEWIAKAEQHHCRAVISSSFESSVGLSMLANLALLTDEAAGLGTGSWFSDDLLTSPVLVQGGVIPEKLLRMDVADIKIERLTLIE